MLAIISSRYQYGPFFCCRSYVKLLDYRRAENFFSNSGGRLRPEALAFATSATWLIQHWFNFVLLGLVCFQRRAKSLAGTNVFEMTSFVLSGT